MEYRVISVLWLHETEQREGPGIYRATRQEAAINELARDGWELVTVTYLPDADRAGMGRIMMFFKRPAGAVGPSRAEGIDTTRQKA